METNIQSQFKKLSISDKKETLKYENQNIEKIQIIYNPFNFLHKSSKNHPEKPERVEKIVEYLELSKYSKNLIEYKNLKQKLNIKEEFLDKLTKQQIVKLHGQNFHDFVQGMWPQGIKKTEMFINIDTYFMKDTYNVAFQAAKTGLLAVQSTFINVKQSNICLIRPPGHHSGMKSQPHGFCFFNNVAIAADYYGKKTNKKVAILDWDIHHGQGTQKIFYERKDVLYISIHRFDHAQFFPHIKQSGPKFVGVKQGQGFNVNICWNLPNKQINKARQNSQTCGDNEYIYVFQNIVLPILKQFNPDAIFISCGFDCADNDPIGDTKVSQNGFKVMSNMIKSLNKKVFVFLQGGYNIQTLQKSTQAVIDGLVSDCEQYQNIEYQKLNQFAKDDIQKVTLIQQKYWNIKKPK